jgi:hypothetical protein
MANTYGKRVNQALGFPYTLRGLLGRGVCLVDCSMER